MYTAIILTFFIVSFIGIYNALGFLYIYGKLYDIKDDNELLEQYNTLYNKMIICMPLHYIFSKKFRQLLKNYKTSYKEYKDKINE